MDNKYAWDCFAPLNLEEEDILRNDPYNMNHIRVIKSYKIRTGYGLWLAKMVVDKERQHYL